MDFLYDESGNAYSFVYNGTQYYYVRNLQGDVVKILNTSGGVVASYTYDAWGKVTSSGSIGQINPIRYRGYYYDTDTGFYYLQSRYYDPAIKRFISADNQLSMGDIGGMNLYSYCGNNPINRIVATGEAWWHWALGAAVVATCAVATVVTCGGFAAAATAVSLVACGTAAATTASTIAASAFITSSIALGTVALSAAMESSSLEDFGDQGNWGIVAYISTAAIYGGGYGYNLANIIPREYKGLGRHTSGTGSPQKIVIQMDLTLKLIIKVKFIHIRNLMVWGDKLLGLTFKAKTMQVFYRIFTHMTIFRAVAEERLLMIYSGIKLQIEVL